MEQGRRDRLISDPESPHVSRTIMSGNSKLPESMDAASDGLGSSLDDDMSTPREDNARGTTPQLDEGSTKRPLHQNLSVDSVSMAASGIPGSSQSQYTTEANQNKRFKTSDLLAAEAAAATTTTAAASNPKGTSVSSSESTPVIQNKEPSSSTSSHLPYAAASKSYVSPPPFNIPRPSRIQRRRSSFGSETLRVTTPKRKSKQQPSSTTLQSHHDGHDGATATQPVLAATSSLSSSQQLMPSRSSSYDEMDSQHQPQTVTTPTLAARTQSASSWGTDEDYDSQPKTPRAPPTTAAVVVVAPPPEKTIIQRQDTGGSASTSYSDLFNASSTSGCGSMFGGIMEEDDYDDDFSRTLSPVAMYSQEGPPAPPCTPASTGTSSAMHRSVIKDLGLATPLPTSAFFVQNVHQLEQRHLEQQQQLLQQKQNQKQQFLLLDDGSETPAPPRPTTTTTASVKQAPEIPAERTEDTKPAPLSDVEAASTTAVPSAQSTTTTITTIAHSNDFTEWAVGDRYQMLRMLGQGSYGQVGQALDLYQGRTDAYVAIKRIQSPFDQQVDAIRLFRELYILRRMRGNECIIQLLDVVQPPSEDLEDFHDLYLVFEYVDTDLYKLIMSPQYLSTEHIQTFLYQMLCGLKYIHSANVIHRDLKPANILLNEDCSLKICDFGLARVVDESSVMASSKQDLLDLAEKKADSRLIDISDLPPTVAQSLPENMTLGRQLTKHVVTRWYRAPELILIQPYTTAVDIWSLGCIFAELLGMQSESIPDFEDRSPLFPGGKCYPLSGDADTEERLDQLNVIFGVIGTPSKADIKDLGQANAYIKTMDVLQPKKLEMLFPAADPAGLDLLRQMLKFNPKHRCTATEALGHDFFKGIRRPEMELSMETPLLSPEFLHAQEIEIDVLKRKTYEEIVWFRNNVDRTNSPTSEA